MGSNFEIRFAGSGGQGLQLSARILATALNAEGKHVSLSQSYEPTSRGGLSRSDLVVGDEQPDYPLVTALDYLVILDQIGTEFSPSLIQPNCLIVADKQRVTHPPAAGFDLRMLSLSEVAMGIGNERVTNIVALGALVELSRICGMDTLKESVLESVPERFREVNSDALAKGVLLAGKGASEELRV